MTENRKVTGSTPVGATAESPVLPGLFFAPGGRRPRLGDDAASSSALQGRRGTRGFASRRTTISPATTLPAGTVTDTRDSAPAHRRSPTGHCRVSTDTTCDDSGRVVDWVLTLL